MATPFDFLNAINSTKVDLLKEDGIVNKDYKPFMVNRGLSYFPDTILYANEMNIHNHLDTDCQFYFLLNSVSKKKRWSKWIKKDPLSKNLEYVKEYFGYSDERAKEALSVLTDKDLNIIIEKLQKGGR
jgi:hypothetical protein